MLCQFTFENFKSFKQEVLLDLFAEPITEHLDSVMVDVDKERFLPVISIYGPNGSGKSTVLEALGYLRLSIIMPVLASKINDDITPEEKQLLNLSINENNTPKFHRFDK